MSWLCIFETVGPNNLGLVLGQGRAGCGASKPINPGARHDCSTIPTSPLGWLGDPVVRCFLQARPKGKINAGNYPVTWYLNGRYIRHLVYQCTANYPVAPCDSVSQWTAYFWSLRGSLYEQTAMCCISLANPRAHVALSTLLRYPAPPS